MSKHIIQAVNFSLSYKDSPFIANLNWTVDESEWIEIKGGNNSGKSTLLNAIYGHIHQCSGQFFVLDFSMTPIAKTDLASLRRKIGYAKQDHNLLYNKTIRANLAMALNAADRIIDQNLEEIIIKLLERFSLNDFLLKEVKDLSFSQQQLVAIARAIIHRPKLLLIDQSFDMLDNECRNKVIEIIQEYRASERITIVSTSILGWANEISNCKNFIMENGSLLAD
jgi:ABC-type multidrug transport system ATPase subunit